jgi:hypothetical protein
MEHVAADVFELNTVFFLRSLAMCIESVVLVELERKVSLFLSLLLRRMVVWPVNSFRF